MQQVSKQRRGLEDTTLSMPDTLPSRMFLMSFVIPERTPLRRSSMRPGLRASRDAGDAKARKARDRSGSARAILWNMMKSVNV